MPVITVKGLGQVRIEGDVPTEAERQNMLAEIERRSEPVIPESVQEALSPLTQLQEGFAGSRDYRTERSLPEQAVRGLGSTALGLARGLPELFAATTEVATDAAMDEPMRPERLFQGSVASRVMEVMRPRARQAAEDIEKIEREMYTASETVPSEAWESLLDDPSRMGRFIVEGVAGSLPHYVATLASPAGYAAALVGDIAKERARREGRDKLNVKDLGVAIPAAASISGLNRAAQLVGLGGPAGAGIISAGIRNALAETGTEIPQGIIDVLARGGSGEEVEEAVIGAATIAPVFGFTTGAGRAAMRPSVEAQPDEATVSPDEFSPEVEAEVAPAPEVAPTPQVEADVDVAAEVAAEAAPDAPPPVDAVDAVIESIDESTVPGEYTQVAPPPLPPEAGPAVDAVDVMMETEGVIERIDKLKSRVKAEGRAARLEVPKRPGTKEVKRKPTRAENQIAEAEGRARATLAAADVVARDSDVDDALTETVAAQARILAGPSEFISASNADVERLLLDMGRTEEDIKSLSEVQRVSYAQALSMLEESDLRSRIEGDGESLEVVIPPNMTALANSINQRPRAASDVEQLAFSSVIAQINTANRRLSAMINDLDQITPRTSAEKGAIQDQIDILTKKKEALNDSFDLFASANRVIGSMWGRAGWMRQRRINDNMSLDEAQGAARSKKGAKLTPKQIELLKSIFNDAEVLRDAATKARGRALKDYNKAKRSLKKAQGVKESADRVRDAARKRVEKSMDRRSPRQKAAEEEALGSLARPIRVTPLRMSAEEKAARKAFRDAERAAKKAAKEVEKKEKEVQEIKGMVAQAEADIRRAKQKKASAPEEAIQHPFFRFWTRQKSIARAMTSSGDDSALGRQGGALVLQNLGAAIRTLPYIVRVNPLKWDPVARRIVHNPASRAAAVEIQEEMLNSPWQTARNWAGLEMSEVEGRTNTDRSGLDAREEYFATHAFDEGGEFLQGVGKYLITPSQNLFGLTLNRLRSVNFDDGLKILAEGEGANLDAVTAEDGDAIITAMIEANAPPAKPRRLRESDEDVVLTKEDIPKLTPEERAEFARVDLAMNVVPRADAEALAVIINASSGRGEWSFGVSDRRGVDIVNRVFRNILFAPKFTASRFETFSHPFQLMAASRGKGRFKNVSPKALKLFRKRVARSLGLTAGLGAMSVIAASFDDDRDPGEALDNFLNPASADFLKGRIGNQRFDALGGVPSTIRYVLPFTFAPIEAWRKSDNPAEWAYHTLISDFGEGTGDKFNRMVRNKLDPLTSAAWSILTQKDYLGRPVREQDFMGMPASELDAVESFIINGLIRPVMGAYTPIMAQSAAAAAIRTMYPHIGEEDRNAFVNYFAPLLWEVIGGGHADYQDLKGTRGYKAKPKRAPKVKRARKRRRTTRNTSRQ